MSDNLKNVIRTSSLDNYHKNQCHSIQHELLQITEQPSTVQKIFISLLVVKADKTMLLIMLIPNNSEGITLPKNPQLLST